MLEAKLVVFVQDAQKLPVWLSDDRALLDALHERRIARRASRDALHETRFAVYALLGNSIACIIDCGSVGSSVMT